MREEEAEARPSIRGEAIEQASAAGAPEIGLGAAAARSLRGMRGIPRLGRRGIVEPHAVVMTDHRRARPALGPVAAGAVVADGEGGAIRLRAGEDVMHVRRVAAAVHDSAPLGQRGLTTYGIGRRRRPEG